MLIDKFALSVLLLVTFSNLLAGQVSHLRTNSAGGIYTLEIKIHIDAPADRLWPLIEDFTMLPLVNDAILEATLLPVVDPDLQRVRIKTRVCIWFFCKHLRHVQDVVYTAKRRVVAVIIPHMSDYRAGWASWGLNPCADGEGSNLAIKVVLMPNFWIPPIIGPYLISRKLRKEGMVTVRGWERLAKRPHDEK